MVIMTGGELFTGNVFFMLAGLLSNKVTPRQLGVNWGISFVFNFLGALAVAYAAFLAGTTAVQPWLGTTLAVATFKSSLPFTVALTRGVLCNWMVCTAIWFALAAQSAAGKFLGIWLLVSSFVAMGFEHSIANMFLIPLGACKCLRISHWHACVCAVLMRANPCICRHAQRRARVVVRLPHGQPAACDARQHRGRRPHHRWRLLVCVRRAKRFQVRRARASTQAAPGTARGSCVVRLCHIRRHWCSPAWRRHARACCGACAKQTQLSQHDGSWAGNHSSLLEQKQANRKQAA